MIPYTKASEIAIVEHHYTVFSSPEPSSYPYSSRSGIGIEPDVVLHYLHSQLYLFLGRDIASS